MKSSQNLKHCPNLYIQYRVETQTSVHKYMNNTAVLSYLHPDHHTEVPYYFMFFCVFVASSVFFFFKLYKMSNNQMIRKR